MILNKIVKLEKKWNKKLKQYESITEMFSAQIDGIAKLKTKATVLEERVKKLERAPIKTAGEIREVTIINVLPLKKFNRKKIPRKFHEKEMMIQNTELKNYFQGPENRRQLRS